MRPSWSSFSSVSLAISRRTPSKPERTTAPGVSSMMKSTPVRFSSARMLRPSRPMIRPFMSSADSCTTDTVVSAAWPAARRCIHTDRMLRTRRSASRLVSSSIWRIRRAASCLVCSSTSLSSSCLARPADRPETCSSVRSSSWRVCTRPARSLSISVSLRAIASSRRATAAVRSSTSALRLESRPPGRPPRALPSTTSTTGAPAVACPAAAVAVAVLAPCIRP